MSALSDIQDAVSALSTKVDAHNANDAAVVSAKDAEIARLQAIIDAGPQGTSDADLATVTASVTAIGAKLS